MVFKRIISLILMLTFVLAVPYANAFADETEQPTIPTEPTEPIPTFEIIGSTIKGDNDYFELSIGINPLAEGFFTAGAVLQYDSSVVVPATWGADASVIDMTGKEDWQNVAVMPSIAPKELSGKMVLAYQDKAEAEPDTDPDTPATTEGEADSVPAAKGYLYISSEAALPITEMPDNGRVITIRFKYAGETDEEKAQSKQKIVEGFENEQVFAIAPDDVAAESPAGQMLIYRGSDDPDSEYYYTANNDNTVGLKIGTLLEKEAAYKFVLNEDAESANTGGGSVDMDSVLSVAFYDWDETLLGILAVPKGEDISLRVNDYLRRFVHPAINDAIESDETIDENEINRIMLSKERTDNYRGKYPSTYGVDETIDLSGSQYPLTNKLDYVFYKGDLKDEGADLTSEDDDFYYFPEEYNNCYFTHGWIEVTTETLDARADNGVFTAYESIEKAVEAEPVDFSAGLSDSIMVKAAYVPGKDLKSGLSDSDYTITNIAYNRYGAATATTGSYSMTATVERVNADKYGVTRLRWPAFKINITPDVAGAQNVAVRIDVDSKDEVTGEIVAPRGSTTTRFDFIDAYTENWLGVAHKAPYESILRDPDPATGKQGYLLLGTIKAVNTAAKDAYEAAITGVGTDFNSIVNTQTYTDLGIEQGNLQGTAFNRTTIARYKFMLAYAANCGQDFDLDYIKAFIASGNNVTAMTLTSDTVYNTALGYIEDAVAANENKPLSAAQTIYALNNEGALLNENI